MSGDLVHHSVWNTNQSDNLAHYASVNPVLAELCNTTKVYPVIGNHEPHSCNLFPPKDLWEKYPQQFRNLFNY